MFFKIKGVIKESQNSTKKTPFDDTISRRTYLWNSAVTCGLENSHNVVQLNPDEDKYYLLTPYPTLMQPLKKLSPESIRAIARNLNIYNQSAYTLNQTFIITFEQNNFKNYSQKWTQSNDNP